MEDRSPTTGSSDSPLTEELDDRLQEAAYQVTGGKLQEGEALARSVLETHPDHPQALYVIGLGLYMRKMYKRSADTFARAAELAPENPMIFANLGESLRRMKQPAEALKAFARAQQLLPNFDMALLGIANCQSDLKQPARAMKTFQKLLMSYPDFAPAYHYVGIHLASIEQHKQALPMLRKAVALRENYFDAQISLSRSLESLDQVDEAVQILEKLLQQQPQNIMLLLNLGNIKKTQGKLDEAQALFARVIEIDPSNVAVRYTISHGLKGEEAVDIASLETQIADERLPKEAKRSLHFTLGKYYDDMGEQDKAFAHWKNGNDMDDRIEPYEAEKFSRNVDLLIEVFNEDFFARRKGLGAEDETPVFIVGMPRSGTSLTEQILSSHSRIYGAGELRNVADIMMSLNRMYKDKPFPQSAAIMDPITACNLGERYIRELRDLAGRGDYDRITDKMPGNSTNLGLIALILPRAKIIHCKRNPMDSCFSNYTHNFSAVISYSRQLTDLGKHYRDYHRIMEHWKKVLPLQIMEVRYEDMVANQESMSRKLIEFCGLEWEAACLEFEKTERRVKTASTIQIRQPMYSSSVSRWRTYESHLQPLYEALGDLAPQLVEGKEVYE